MTKADIVNALLASGKASELYDLLLGVSPSNDPPPKSAQSVAPHLALTKLVNAARNHLQFVSKYGFQETHVIENGAHYFAYRSEFEQWLRDDAPGVSRAALERLLSLSVRQSI